MLRDITLGQFFPGNTFIHRLDPRTKLLAVILYIVALFNAQGVVTYAIVTALLALCIIVSRVPFRSLTRGLKPIWVIVAFTAIMNLFFTSGTPLGAGWLLSHISQEGLRSAIFMVLRIVMLIMGTFLLTYTTSPISLTDGLESLLSPLKKLRLPVHELAMMMSIALRFIPTLIEETDKIMSAQKARGADFESGNIFQRAKALVPILVPLFISAFRRADELATAMECRCYHGGEGRTALHVLRFRPADLWVLTGFAALTAGVIALGRLGICKRYAMRNIALILMYNGTAYHGWQVQKTEVTVAQTLERGLSMVCGEPIKCTGCGRTDAGVHAEHYVANFRTNSRIPVDRLPFAVNTHIPEDIVVKAAYEVAEDFNAIGSCIRKEYTYRIYNSRVKNPFYVNRAYFYPKRLDEEVMDRAARMFEGTHDFAAVRSVGTNVRSTVRTIYYCRVRRQGELLELKVCANGFLYNMVRAITGTVLYAAEGKLTPEEIPVILDSGNRTLAGPTAPPGGLYLTRVWYEDERLNGPDGI